MHAFISIFMSKKNEAEHTNQIKHIQPNLRYLMSDYCPLRSTHHALHRHPYSDELFMSHFKTF
jgi:hypothetical protein